MRGCGDPSVMSGSPVSGTQVHIVNKLFSNSLPRMPIPFRSNLPPSNLRPAGVRSREWEPTSRTYPTLRWTLELTGTVTTPDRTGTEVDSGTPRSRCCTPGSPAVCVDLLQPLCHNYSWTTHCPPFWSAETGAQRVMTHSSPSVDLDTVND